MKLILLSLLIIMFSSVARAFSTHAVRPALYQPRLYSVVTARSMSSGGAAGPDTSVVAICMKKIQDAMGTENVKVTGTSDTTYPYVVTNQQRDSLLPCRVDELVVELADGDQ
jgi:hypothetical protein